MYVYLGASVVAIVLAILLTVIFGAEGTPTGATRASLDGYSVCEGLRGTERERCLLGDSATNGNAIRDVESSSNSGRNSRGSGIAGVTSGGTTTDPPASP